QSLLLLRQSEANILPDIKGLVLKGGENGIIDLGKGKDVYCIHAEDDFIQFEVDINYTKFLNNSYRYDAESDRLPLITSEDFHHENYYPSLFTERFTYLKAERIAPEHIYKANLAAVKQERFLGYRGENVPLFIALYKLEPVKLDSVIHKKAKANNLISNIDAWLEEITPGAHVISTYFNQLDVVKVGYQFDIGNDFTPEFSPVNVGFGFTYILPIITAILSSERGDLIIIENPESHLHPQGQAKLGELLSLAAQGGVQIIIESHSDHIFNGLRVAVKNRLIECDNVSVFYFERDEHTKEHITTITQPVIDENGRIDIKPKGFFDEYSKQLDSLIK
ncbi:MAG: AAA family ATPase, partial [Flavipsychrobacter sp.]